MSPDNLVNAQPRIEGQADVLLNRGWRRNIWLSGGFYSSR